MNQVSKTSAVGIAAVALLAVVISLLSSHYSRPQVLRFDEQYYFSVGKSIAGGYYDDNYIVRPPLYPVFVGIIFRIFGPAIGVVLIIQSLLRGLLVAEVGWLGRRYFSRWTGLLASVLVAIYPLVVWIYTRLLNEALYLPIFVISIWAVERAYRSQRDRDSFIAGLVCGMASLVRVTSFFLTLLLALFFALRPAGGRFSTRALRPAVLLVAGLFVAISPWTIRNLVVHKTFMPIGNEAAFNLYFTVAGTSVDEARQRWDSWGSQAERQKEALRLWEAYLREHPAHHVRRFIGNLPRVFNPRSQGFATGLAVIYSGTTCRRNMTLNTLVSGLIRVTFVLVMFGGLVGIATVRTDPATRWIWLIAILYFLILHPATVMKARYFLPLVPPLSIFASRLLEVSGRWLDRLLRKK